MSTLIQIKSYLDGKGFKHAQLGFGYTAEAISECQKDESLRNKVTVLYAHIGKMHNIPGSRVERAIRHSISTVECCALPNSEFIAKALDDLEAET